MYPLLSAPKPVGDGVCGLEASFDELPLMAAVEQGGLIVERNRLLRMLSGQGAESAAVESVLQGLDGLSPVGRQRFDAVLMRRHGSPIPVSAVAQSCMWKGQGARIILMLERLDGACVGTGADGDRTFLEDVLDATPEATVITHEGRVLHVNREFTRMFGFASGECVGQDLDGLVVPEGLEADNEVIFHELEHGGRAAIETVRRTRAGEAMDVSVLVSRIRLGGEALGLLVTYRDIRKQKREEARLQFNALHDGLTGLANRALFLDRLALTLARLRRRPDRGFAVVFLDLDGFKQVNDTLGHAGGDELLVVVARRLVDALRPQDTVARFGGDEFALLLDESGGVEDVERVALRVLLALHEGIEIGGAVARISASLGVVMGTREYVKAEELVRDADEAMYRAKAGGKSRYVLFEGGVAEAAAA